MLNAECPGVVVQLIKETDQEKDRRTKKKYLDKCLVNISTIPDSVDQFSFSLNLCTCSMYGASIDKKKKTNIKDQCPWKIFEFIAIPKCDVLLWVNISLYHKYELILCV